MFQKRLVECCVILIALALLVVAANELCLQRKWHTVRHEDSRLQAIDVGVHFDLFVKPNTLFFDVRSVAAGAPESVVLRALAAFLANLVTPYKIVEVPLAVLLVLVALYSLLSNFNLEMDERQSFLQTERTTRLRDELEQSNLNLHNMSLQDPLTGLANRRRFDAFVTALFERAPHATLSLGVWLVDVDHFKAFNDRYGHPAGDQCLRQVAQALSAALPPEHGLLARWGGEEFAVVLPGADHARCEAVGEALRRSVEMLSMRHEASSTAPHVTISAGGALSASCRSIQGVEALLKLADEGLYQAKAQGRNRWSMADASVPAQP